MDDEALAVVAAVNQLMAAFEAIGVGPEEIKLAMTANAIRAARAKLDPYTGAIMLPPVRDRLAGVEIVVLAAEAK